MHTMHTYLTKEVFCLQVMHTYLTKEVFCLQVIFFKFLK